MTKPCVKNKISNKMNQSNSVEMNGRNPFAFFYKFYYNELLILYLLNCYTDDSVKNQQMGHAAFY